jgi:hypothetical protein
MDNLDNPDEYYAIVRQILELNAPIIGSAVAFEPYYNPQKGEHFSPYAYRTVNGAIETKQLGSAEYEYHCMDWYQIPKLLKKNYWSEPYYDTGGGEQMMTTYSHPLYDKNGSLIAVITADVSLNWLTELVAKSDIELNARLLETEIDSTNLEVDDTFFYTHAYSFIIGRGATYITHPNSERILNDTYFVYSMETNDSIDAQIGYDMVDGLSGMREIDRDGVRRNRGERKREERNIQNNDALVQSRFAADHVTRHRKVIPHQARAVDQQRQADNESHHQNAVFRDYRQQDGKRDQGDAEHDLFDSLKLVHDLLPPLFL